MRGGGARESRHLGEGDDGLMIESMGWSSSDSSVGACFRYKVKRSRGKSFEQSKLMCVSFKRFRVIPTISGICIFAGLREETFD